MAFPLLIDRYSSELVQFLRLCCAQPSDLPLEGLKYNERISPQNERAALGALIAGCEQALAEYPESEAEDAAMMDNARLFAALTRLPLTATILSCEMTGILKMETSNSLHD